MIGRVLWVSAFVAFAAALVLDSTLGQSAAIGGAVASYLLTLAAILLEPPRNNRRSW